MSDILMSESSITMHLGSLINFWYVNAGTIQVDGENGNGTNAGGGSGGTIDITTPILEGNGDIRSNGGLGDNYGGGGAGGRMFLRITDT